MGYTPSAAPRRHALAAAAATVVVAVGLVLGATGRWAHAAERPAFHDGFGITVLHTIWTGARTADLDVRTDQVAGDHHIEVVLPDGYDAAANTRYPVLYLLHGAGDTPGAWAAPMERLTAGMPIITVIPDGGLKGWYANWVHAGPAGSQNWETFHTNEVVPLVDANLRTEADRHGRAVAGASMGGYGAFHYAEHRPDLFGYAGSFSGALDLLNQSVRATIVAEETIPSNLVQAFGPAVGPDAIFGPPVWPHDQVWTRQSPAQHVAALAGTGIAIYVGNGGSPGDGLPDLVENQLNPTAWVTHNNLNAAGIPHYFNDYGDGSGWGCDGRHDGGCWFRDIQDFLPRVLGTLRHP